MDNMDNDTRIIPDAGDDNWLDGILDAPELRGEIGPDEQAVHAAGLTHPEDLEMEQIMEETASSNWEIPPEMAPEPFRDEEYRDTFGEGRELDELFEDGSQETMPPLEQEKDEAEEENVPEEDPPVRKGRPRRKKGYGLFGIPHVLATVIWLAITLAIGVSLGRMIWVCAADVLAFGRESQEIQFTITDTDNMDTIATKLKNAGLVRYPELFKLYADLTHAEEKISAGTFTLNTIYDYHAMVNAMRPNANGREVVKVMIPEGYSCAQIFKVLEENGVCTVEELEQYAANGELGEYWFLDGVERGDKYCLEGYLFPDTYEFYTNDEPGRVLGKFLNAFDDRFTDIMRDKLVTLNERLSEKLARNGYGQEYIDSHQMTIREVVIVASMIEREAANNAESFTISSVIYNRLTNPDFPYLNIDATIVYALGGKTDPLTAEDLQIDSPYNTYTHAGLTPGPIANPGRESLYAALDPDDESYYYYALDPETGVHHFSKTYDEHQRFLDSLN